MIVEPWRRLTRMVRVDRGEAARLAAVSVVGAILPMAAVVLIHQFLAAVLGGETTAPAAALVAAVGTRTAMWLLAALLLGTFLASAAANYFVAILQERFVRTIELDVMERLVRHLLTLSVLTLDRRTPGDLIETVREDVQKLRATIVAYSSGVVALLTAAALTASAIWLSPVLAAIAFPLLLIAALPVVQLARQSRGQGQAVRRRAARVFDLMLQLLRGIRVIRVYRGEEAEAQRVVAQMRHYFAAVVSLTRARAAGQVALESLGGFGTVVVIIVGGVEVMGGRLDWPALLAFVIAVRGTQGPLVRLNTQLTQVQRHVASLERLQALFDEPPVRDTASALPLAPPLRALAFERVSFRYHDGTMALREVSFEVAHGEVLGIVGPSAAGKTTLLNLAARFFDPTAGAVHIDGVDLRRYRLADLYSQIAIVTQEPFLFSTSIRDNILCGRPTATADEVEAAARAAEIHDEILALPAGYDTRVGPGHRQLSGGQIQRVNVARAILKNAPLLLLDEATSSLDSIAEARVQRAMARLMQGRTSLVVAHRLSTLRMATRIVVLAGGSVAGIGRHDDLLLRVPLYRRMWEAQIVPDAADDAAIWSPPVATLAKDHA